MALLYIKMVPFITLLINALLEESLISRLLGLQLVYLDRIANIVVKKLRDALREVSKHQRKKYQFV